MKKVLYLILFLLSSAAGFSQQKKKVTEPKVVKEAVPLQYTVYWGPIKNGDAPVVQVVSTLPAPLIVKDQFSTIYQVSSFRINYTFVSTYKDEETQQTKSLKDFRVMDVNNSNKLTNDWIESIKDNIKPGDQILLNKIMFKNAVGKLQMVSDLRVSVK